jgi:hypothetical protein
MFAFRPEGSCVPSNGYCTLSVNGDPDSPYEVFSGLPSARDSGEIARHGRVTVGSTKVEAWYLWWADPTTQGHYQLLIQGPNASQYGTAFSPNNQRGVAEKLAALAGQLLVWAGRDGGEPVGGLSPGCR